ncbi:MAG TPA: hypothetical protein VFE25_01835, partial [Opitutaceae bacterium]|nr:hypothetical protein [Opitutaceae bacterium]
MNKLSVTAAALVAAGFCASARAGFFSDKFEMLVVAERSADAPASTTTTPCALVDGGYIEAGDPIAGENPPSAASVRQELQDALGQQGFHVGSAAPAVVITYHWGILRVDHIQIHPRYGINSNADARIRLVSTDQDTAEVENHILGRKGAPGENIDASSPVILIGPLETVVENARKPRYFVIVSAYDYRAAADHTQPKLLWRAKLSAQESAGEFSEVIPALIATGAPYFGKTLPETKIVETTLMKSVTPTSAEPTGPQSALVSSDPAAQSIGA